MAIFGRLRRRDDPEGDRLRTMWAELEAMAMSMELGGQEVPADVRQLLDRRRATLESMRAGARRGEALRRPVSTEIQHFGSAAGLSSGEHSQQSDRQDKGAPFAGLYIYLRRGIFRGFFPPRCITKSVGSSARIAQGLRRNPQAAQWETIPTLIRWERPPHALIIGIIIYPSLPCPIRDNMDTVMIYQSQEVEAVGPSQWAAAWVEGLDVKPRTREAYAKNIGYYLAWLSSEGLRGTSRADILAYKEHLTASHEAATVSAYLTAVRVFYAWLSLTYGVPDIARGIKGAKAPRGFRKDPLSADQVRAVLSGIDTEAPEGLRDYAMVSLMAHTGLRVVEIQRADVCDIRPVMGRSVLYVQGKGRDEKDEFVVLSPAVLRALGAYLKARGVWQWASST